MRTSLFLAQLIGPVALAAAVALITQRERFEALSGEALSSPMFMYLSGVLAMLGGLAIVLTHNDWALDWRVLITLLGWTALLGGAARILFPGQVRALGRDLVRNSTFMAVGKAFWLLIGLVLCYFGYLT